MSQRWGLVFPGLELVRSGRWALGLSVMMLVAHAVVCTVGIVACIAQARPGASYVLTVVPLAGEPWGSRVFGGYPGQLPNAATGVTLAVEVGHEGTSVERLDPIVPNGAIVTRQFRRDLAKAIAGLLIALSIDGMARRRRSSPAPPGGNPA